MTDSHRPVHEAALFDACFSFRGVEVEPFKGGGHLVGGHPIFDVFWERFLCCEDIDDAIVGKNGLQDIFCVPFIESCQLIHHD